MNIADGRRRSSAWSRFIQAAMLSLLASGCGGNFGEVHLMATVDKKSGDVANVFRVEVSGLTRLTNARYLAGYYDEKAVEAFFNETKASTIDFSNLNTLVGTSVPAFSRSAPCVNSPACATGVDTNLAPLGSLATGGAFMLILSTNPDAIVSTIGAFVDNDQNVQSAMFLLTRGDRASVAKLGATQSVTAATRAGVAKELGDLLPQGDSHDLPAKQRQQYLAALGAVASGLAPGSAPNFATVKEARQWFAALSRGASR